MRITCHSFGLFVLYFYFPLKTWKIIQHNVQAFHFSPKYGQRHNKITFTGFNIKYYSFQQTHTTPPLPLYIPSSCQDVNFLLAPHYLLRVANYSLLPYPIWNTCTRHINTQTTAPDEKLPPPAAP
uniref:Uncharacterized protein n=1 Tax=Cacopsylla melanoneura TaxID=428564 RepID=A0A8D9BNF7_9HEMI